MYILSQAVLFQCCAGIELYRQHTTGGELTFARVEHRASFFRRMSEITPPAHHSLLRLDYMHTGCSAKGCRKNSREEEVLEGNNELDKLVVVYIQSLVWEDEYRGDAVVIKVTRRLVSPRRWAHGTRARTALRNFLAPGIFLGDFVADSFSGFPDPVRVGLVTSRVLSV